MWTAQSVLIDGGRDGPELCGIINAAIRLDDSRLAQPLAVVARAINQACTSANSACLQTAW